MQKKEATATPQVHSTISGCGILTYPVSVLPFFCSSEPLMTEAEWVRLGRPCWQIRYTMRSTGDTVKYAYSGTWVPACGRLIICLTCPCDTVAMECGVSLGGIESWTPISYRQLAADESATAVLAAHPEASRRWTLWDHSAQHWTHQLFQMLDRANVSKTPQYADGSEPAPGPRPKRVRKPKPAPPPADDVTVEVDRMIAEGSPDVPATDTDPIQE